MAVAAVLAARDIREGRGAARVRGAFLLSRRLATHRIGWLLALRGGERADAVLEAAGRLEAAGASEIRLGPLD